MRLALVNQFYVPDLSPTAHLCASLARHRAAKGDRVTMITSRSGYIASSSQSADDHGVDVQRLHTTNLGSTSLPRRFIDWLSFYVLAIVRVTFLPKQDVIICLTTPPFIAIAGIVHKLLHPTTRLALWNMDSYPEALERTGMIKPGGLIARIMRMVNRMIFRRIDQLICLDGAMRDLLMSQYAPKKRPLPAAIIPNWEVDDSRENDAVQTWNDPVTGKLKDRFVVLYFGNAGYGHEFATMLDAAQQLYEAKDPFVFLFVGGGAMRGRIRGEADRRGIGNILFCDYVPFERRREVLQIADCALITLENYAAGVMSPSKLHGNLAMRLPILYVGPQATNVDEAIARFSCGVSLRPGNSGGMVSFIRSLMADRALQEDFRAAARAAYEQAYCDRQTLGQFDELLDLLAVGDN